MMKKLFISTLLSVSGLCVTTSILAADYICNDTAGCLYYLNTDTPSVAPHQARYGQIMSTESGVRLGIKDHWILYTASSTYTTQTIAK